MIFFLVVYSQFYFVPAPKMWCLLADRLCATFDPNETLVSPQADLNGADKGWSNMLVCFNLNISTI